MCSVIHCYFLRKFYLHLLSVLMDTTLSLSFISLSVQFVIGDIVIAYFFLPPVMNCMPYLCICFDFLFFFPHHMYIYLNHKRRETGHIPSAMKIVETG